MLTVAELESAWRAGGGHLGSVSHMALRCEYGDVIGFPLPGCGTVTPGPSYDAATEAIAAAFTTPPTTARKDLIDAAVVALKAAGVWSKLDALYAFAAADSQAALINWKAPGTYNATLVNAPAFTADSGFTGPATKYIDTGFIASSAPSPKYTLNSATVFGWSLTTTSTAGAGMIECPAPVHMRLHPFAGTTTYGRLNSGGVDQTAAPANGSGLFLQTRVDATNATIYRNGTSLVTGALGVVGVPTTVIYALGAGWDGQSAAVGFGQGLNSTEVTALYNALRTYLTGVGVP